MNYEGIYQEYEAQSSCTIEYIFSILGSMRAFDRTNLLMACHYCNHVQCWAWYWDAHICWVLGPFQHFVY